MIFPLAGLVIGALLGVVMARRQGGKSLDQMQWAGVFALIGGVVGMFILVFIDRANYEPSSDADTEQPAAEGAAEPEAEPASDG